MATTAIIDGRPMRGNQQTMTTVGAMATAVAVRVDGIITAVVMSGWITTTRILTAVAVLRSGSGMRGGMRGGRVVATVGRRRRNRMWQKMTRHMREAL